MQRLAQDRRFFIALGLFWLGIAAVDAVGA